MNLLHILFLVLICIGAGFVQRVSGFGLGIFVMMFLPHFMSSHTEVATISSLFSCVTATYNAVRYRVNVQFKTVLPMVCAALISIPVAVYFSVVVSGEIFGILLGVVLILLSIYFMLFSNRITIKPTLFNGILAGTLSGMLHGLFSTGGPPAVLYLSNATNKNIAYFATIQFFFCVISVYATVTRAVQGIISAQLLAYAAIGMVGCMIGDFFGKMVFDKLDSQKLKFIIYVGMIISGIVMLF